MTTELKVSKGPLGEYLHLNIPLNDIIGEPNRVMGDVCDDYDDCRELDWII